MKTIFYGRVAAAAFASMGGAAHAQTHSILNPVNESVTTTTTVSQRPNPAFGNGNNNQPAFTSNGCPGNPSCVTTSTTVTETAFTITGSAPDDTEAAMQTISHPFNLTGTVNQDCSFYAGNTAGARTIDFGVIGVRTGDNENVNSAFEMAGELNANINTLTAGCNSNNTVTIAKGDQFGSGLTIVGAPSGYDQTQFRTNIAYTVTATWTGVPKDQIVVGTPQNLVVGLPNAEASLDQGAWRSAMNIAINAPVADRALVAGTYTDTLTVTLSAL